MNIRFSTVTLAAIITCALGACTVESSGSTSTSTSTTSTATATATGTGGSGGGATGTGGEATGGGGNGGSGGSTACDPDYTCAEAIAPLSGNPAQLCEGPAKMLFTALSACTCMGACAADCADSSCKGNDPSTACKICLSNTATGCGKEFNACTGG